jgi:hypothetical protein
MCVVLVNKLKALCSKLVLSFTYEIYRVFVMGKKILGFTLWKEM